MAQTTVTDTLVRESAARIFADLADPQALNAARGDAWKAPLWSALEESGLTLAWVPEALGGAGASLQEGFDIVAEAGRHAAPVPIAETLLAGWLLSRAGLRSPRGPMAVVFSRSHSAVPFASEAEHLVVVDGSRIGLIERKLCEISPVRGIGGDPLDAVTVRNVKFQDSKIQETEALLMGCVVRSVQIAGALQSVLELALRYAGERVAFEKPIGRFQAVQHNLARLAEEVSAALAGSGSAADAFCHSDKFNDELFLEAASAKIRCAEAAQEGAAIAHQIFGAIGYSDEHILHRYTLRMLGWRDDFGNESWWAAELGRRVGRLGADGLWPLISSR